MKKNFFWYPILNIKNRFIFGSYGKDVYIERGVIINRPRFVHIGDYVRIKKNTSINLHPRGENSKQGLLFIGSKVMISEGCIISAFNQIIIEENVIIGPHVLIVDNTRRPGDISIPLINQDVDVGYVRIGRDSFIGYSSCILPNVTVGINCVIGALSVVTKDIPDYSVAIGSPAKVIKRYDFEKSKWVRVDG